MDKAKWDMTILKKFNTTSHTKIIHFLKNELINHPLERKDAQLSRKNKNNPNK